MQVKLSSEQTSDYKAWFEPFDFIGSRQNVHLTDHKVEHLRQALQTFSDVDPFSVSGSCHKYKNIEIFVENNGSSDSRLSRSSVVLASWCGTDGEINMDGNDERCGIVRFYLSAFLPFNRFNGTFDAGIRSLVSKSVLPEKYFIRCECLVS